MNILAVTAARLLFTTSVIATLAAPSAPICAWNAGRGVSLVEILNTYMVSTGPQEKATV